MYDASKKASNQQLQVRMLGSSIKLSLLSRRTSKVQLTEIPRVKNVVQSRRIERKLPFLTRARHVRHVISCERPIEIKRKMSFK